MHEGMNKRMNGQRDKNFILGAINIGLPIFSLHATYKISRS